MCVWGRGRRGINAGVLIDDTTRRWKYISWLVDLNDSGPVRLFEDTNPKRRNCAAIEFRRTAVKSETWVHLINDATQSIF